MSAKNPANASCFSCPSFLSEAEAAVFFRKGIGAPVCARFGKPIGNNNSTEQEQASIAKHFASNCSSYGEDRPAVPSWNNAKFQVMLPDPNIIGEPRTSPQLVNACSACSFFVKEEIVAKELGWSAALCSAKGRLLLSNRYTLEARDCVEKGFGTLRASTAGLTFLPEYDRNFVSSSDPVRAYSKQKANFVDPVDYPTDKEISADDEAHGIRAWRKIEDPATKNEVFIPIYSLDFFSEEERQKIPRTGDDEHPEDFVDHGFYTYKTSVLWTELDETPALWGEAGTGKTEFFRHMAWLMCLPFERFSITGSTEVDDLAGKMHFTPEKGTYWQDGRLVSAWSKPCVLVLDEWNTGQPDVQQFVRPMIDNSKQLVVDQGDNPVPRERHTDCYFGVAMNPAWDSMNIGANMISDADANRLMHMFVALPPESLEREIIKTRCAHDGFDISNEMLETVMKIAHDIRILCQDSTLPVSWAIRPQLKVARALRWFDYITAYRMASADYLEPESQQQLLDIVRTHI